MKKDGFYAIISLGDIMKLYAIKDDKNNAIVDNWEEALKIIKTYNKPKYKSFSTFEEAKAFINDEIYTKEVSGPKAYIDGSYDDKTKAYSFGGILIIDDKEYTFKKKYENDEYIDLRNVAGEIKGAGFIINYAIKLGLKELNIFYDYLGIEKWYTHEWKANSKVAVEYSKFADSVKDKIIIKFHKVKSHTNDYYNDIADKLAKEALGV